MVGDTTEDNHNGEYAILSVIFPLFMNAPGYMNKFFEVVPIVIKEASQNPLGIFALMIIAVSTIAYLFFRKSPWKMKMCIFVCFFLGVVCYGVVIARTMLEEREQSPQQKIIRAVGIGMPMDNSPDETQKCLSARRAAVVVAKQELAENVRAEIVSQTVVENFKFTEEEIEVRVNSVLQGTQIIEEEKEDGCKSYKVVVETLLKIK